MSLSKSTIPFAWTRRLDSDALSVVELVSFAKTSSNVSSMTALKRARPVATGPQAAACRQSASCLGRFNGLLNETEQTIDRTIKDLRESLGPNAVILMRTQYNALLRPGCAAPDVVTLLNITLEGVPGTVLDRGLNDRIRSVAAKYHAHVVDLFLPFAANANTFVASDCIHPSGDGYQAIATLSGAAYLAGP